MAERAFDKSGDNSVHIGSSTDEVVVNIESLIVDDAYQRPLSMTWARKIAREFDPKKFGKPLVSPRPDGKYSIIDGQHRIWALRIRYPKKSVTVRVDVLKDANSIVDEASRFEGENFQVKKPDTASLLKVKLAQGDPDAVAYKQIIESAGYRTKSGGGRLKPGEIHAYVFKTAPRFGSSTWQRNLDDALTVCQMTWGSTTYPLGSTIVGGLVLFFRTYDGHSNLNSDDLVRRLQKTTPMALEADAGSLAAMKRTRKEYALREVVRGIYNRRLSPEKKLPE